MPTETPEHMYTRAHKFDLTIGPLPRFGQFYRPPGAPLRPTSLPADVAYERKLTYYAALAGLLLGLMPGFGAAWLVVGWMWAQ